MMDDPAYRQALIAALLNTGQQRLQEQQLQNVSPLTAFTNGAKAWWDGAKWVAGGGQYGWNGQQNNGPQPPMYTGGPDYPTGGK